MKISLLNWMRERAKQRGGILLWLGLVCLWQIDSFAADSGQEANEDPFGNRNLAQGATYEVQWYRDAFRNAVIDDNLVLVEAFLRHGMKPALPDIHSKTGDILHDAADLTRDPRMIRLLLANGAKPGGGAHDREATVNYALRMGNKEIVDLLIAAGAACDPVWYDAALGFVDDLKKRDAQEPMDARASAAALDYAVSAGQVETFDWLWAKARGEDAAKSARHLESFYDRSAGGGRLALLSHLEDLGVKPPYDSLNAICLALAGGHVAIARHFADKGLKLPPDTYFLSAVIEGHLEMVQLLFDHGANINLRGQNGLTPLRCAAQSGRDDICQFLIQRGADLEAPTDDGHTAIWDVVGGRHCPGALALMLANGADIPIAKDARGLTLFEGAFAFTPHQAGRMGFPGRVLTMSQLRDYEQGEEGIIDLLVSAGFDPSSKAGNVTPLMALLGFNHYPAARALLRHHPDLQVKDSVGYPAIFYLFDSCRGRFPVDVLETFLKQGCDPNGSYPIPDMTPPTELTALEQALGSFSHPGDEERADHRTAVRKLLEYGGKFPGVKSEADQALLRAAASGDLKKMQEAVSAGASLNVKESLGYTPLLISAILGYGDNFAWLLAQGADPQQSATKLGESLWPAIVRANRADTVRLLIAKGVDVSKGNSGLNIAVETGNEEIFNALIEAGANPKDADVFSCIQNGRVAMARVLLRLGVDPQPPPVAENRGNVYWTVYYNQPEILKLLLERGAQPDMVDIYRETPLSMAEKFRKEMVPILEEAIAKRATETKKEEAKKDGAK
ncbi:ankyrin repeat protein [Chthoniobacter flavus]|uniref:ankyrin repeat domain-containing protein n=1 Tax=Chthoniobacter flavus TaxID=191863 RepID=UPI0010D00984|nr:ankyrin repeat domain-containing protein [Chthoniobacter flavus]TCO86097.1 ankyrin repeat protein [Chthoniobacter flavus]